MDGNKRNSREEKELKRLEGLSYFNCFDDHAWAPLSNRPNVDIGSVSSDTYALNAYP